MFWLRKTGNGLEFIPIKLFGVSPWTVLNREKGRGRKGAAQDTQINNNTVQHPQPKCHEDYRG